MSHIKGPTMAKLKRTIHGLLQHFISFFTDISRLVEAAAGAVQTHGETRIRKCYRAKNNNRGSALLYSDERKVFSVRPSCCAVSTGAKTIARHIVYTHVRGDV